MNFCSESSDDSTENYTFPMITEAAEKGMKLSRKNFYVRQNKTA